MSFLTWIVPLFLLLLAGSAGLLIWGFCRKERNYLYAAALLLGMSLMIPLTLGEFLARM